MIKCTRNTLSGLVVFVRVLLHMVTADVIFLQLSSLSMACLLTGIWKCFLLSDRLFAVATNLWRKSVCNGLFQNSSMRSNLGRILTHCPPVMVNSLG